jgi:uncharacterized protein
MFVLNLNRIRTAEEHFEQVYSPERFAADPDFRVVVPVALTFEVVGKKKQFRLVGRLKTTLELVCGRCLEAFSWPVDASFDLRYQPLAVGGGQEVERQIEEDDLSTAVYEHDEIDLALLMREQFVLSLPMKPLCRDECKGLCTVCGTNLNRGACGCKRDWEDPRLAPLKALKKES